MWAQNLIDMLLCMKTDKGTFLSKNQSNAPPELIEDYSAGFDEILSDALLNNPLPPVDGKKRGRPKRGKVRALIDRLVEHKDKYLAFFSDFSVPFDNNQAERDFRLFKVKQKVSGCFRAKQGADDFATIFSYTSTARKRGFSVFRAIKTALLGDPSHILTSDTD